MDAFPGIAHEDLLKLVFSISILVASARLLGEAARRFHQPAVVGEILAGVVLGPSLLSGFFPGLGSWLLPQTETQAQLLEAVALMGVLLLMIVVGLETDLGLIRARWRTAAGVGFGGLVVPFLLGLGAAAFVPGGLIVGGSRLVFALFLAVALALSAIPVLAKILSDLGLLRREFGQTALAAGMIDDICGWALLGMVISLASSGELTGMAVVTTIGAIAIFFGATFLGLRPLVAHGVGFVGDRFSSRDLVLTFVVVVAFGWGAFSQWLHLEPVLGAFVAGVLFGQVRHLPVDVVTKLESVTNGVFAPLFLATAGLRLRLDVLAEPGLLLATLGLFLVAAAGKLLGGFVGGRYLAGKPARESLGYGIALNARGVLGIVVASIGLSMHIFGIEVYSMIVVISVLTSVLAPIGLERVLGGSHVDEPGATERSVPLFRRPLMPVRPRDERGDEVRSLEVSVLESLASPDVSITIVSAADQSTRSDAEAYLRALGARFSRSIDVRARVLKGDPIPAILTAAKNHDLLALGAPEMEEGDDHLFGATIDDLVRLAPCPTMVFMARGNVWPPRTILVPTGGAAPATRAAEVAFALADEGTTVVLFNVIDAEDASETGIGASSSYPVRMEIAQDIVTGLARVGERLGARVATEVVQGGAMTASVVKRARRGVDLVVLGTGVRPGAQRLFLGPRVDRLVRDLPCSTVVLNV